ncbi:MAG: UPF0149 family protein [Pseudomonadota bacterium]
MQTDPLQAALSVLDGARDDEAYAQRVADAAKTLLADPAQGAALARQIVGLAEDAPLGNLTALWRALLDEARMAQENGFEAGAAVLRAVEGEITSLRQEGALDGARHAVLAQGFAAASLTVPAALRIDDVADPPAFADTKLSAEAQAALGTHLETLLREAGGDPLQVHAQLVEHVAAAPDATRAAMAADIARGSGASRLRLGLYFLLDRSAAVREAVAATVEARAQAGSLDADALSSLLALRRVLPEEPARTHLDTALRAAMRREASGPARAADWVVHRVLALPPDGAGALSLAAAVQRGGRRLVVFLMLKAGHGLKDAFTVPCASATEQRGMMSKAYGDLDALEVDPALAPQLLRFGLWDGVQAGALPAPGFLDAAEIWADADLTPEQGDAEGLLRVVDPSGEIAAMSAQARGRLLTKAVEAATPLGMTDSWFEDNETVRQIVIEARSQRGLETGLWRYLETRRGWWARHWALIALLLRAEKTPRADWRVFAATAVAMTEGRALKKTPLMQAVFAATLMASAERVMGDKAGSIPEAWLETSGFAPAEPDAPPAHAPERHGEMAALLAGGTLTEGWLDGFLAAAVVAPLMAPPTEWLHPIFERMVFRDEPTMHRFVEIVMLRAKAANDWCSSPGEAANRLARLGDAGRRDWAAGFAAFTQAVPDVWPRHALDAEDGRTLKDLGRAAKAGIGADLALALPAWLSKRFDARL